MPLHQGGALAAVFQDAGDPVLIAFGQQPVLDHGRHVIDLVAVRVVVAGHQEQAVAG
jgi:hypothetical protein